MALHVSRLSQTLNVKASTWLVFGSQPYRAPNIKPNKAFTYCVLTAPLFTRHSARRLKVKNCKTNSANPFRVFSLSFQLLVIALDFWAAGRPIRLLNRAQVAES